MSVLTLPDTIRQLAYLSEIRGDAEAAELRAAVQTLDRFSPAELDNLLQAARTGPFSALHSFSPSTVRAIREIALAGDEAASATMRIRIPWLLRRLLDLGTATHAEASTLVRDFGLLTISDLTTAIDDGRIAQLPEPLAQRLSASSHLLTEEWRSHTLGRAWEILAGVQSALTTHCRSIERTAFAGDTRRHEPLVTDLVLVAQTDDAAAVIDCLTRTPGVDDLLHRSGRRAIVGVQHVEVDLRFAGADHFGTVLFTATGTPRHVAAVTNRRRPGLCAREAEVYTRAGLAWIPPELRSASGEIERASTGRMPRLLERGDIRGDLHMHSTYSDGQDTIEAMVAAAAALDYEYVAITDHSANAAASRTVTLDQLARQRDEIGRVREQFPGIAILHGIEVDILANGRLDFDDVVLERLDIVLASLHDAAQQDGPALTRRCIGAIRHPLVNIITHPSNQLVGRRAGYPMDYEAIYAAAAETGTALEVDGAPSHLDLDGERARAAVAAGVTLTVDSDCHRCRALELQMEFGVGMARRGWVEPQHVLNTRPVAQVRAFVEAKRAGGRA